MTNPANNDPRNGGGQSWKGAIFFAIAIAIAGGAILSAQLREREVDVIPYPRLAEMLDKGEVIVDGSHPLELVVEEGRASQVVSGWRRGEGGGVTPFQTAVFVPFNGDDLRERLSKAGASPSIRVNNNTWGAVAIGLLPIMVFLLVLFLLFNAQAKIGGGGAFGFGKSRARMAAKEKNGTTLKDVAGAEEAKDEVGEIVDFLRDPKKFQALGGRIPKGILMVGAPGTGKTLLARAIAGEAGVPFYAISGSDFVEMFVGVGASRVRDMFEQARKNAPCLIFIDEIDAVGRHRGHGVGGGHDEREQTLNALLVEMDGFDAQDGVIIMAATNRPDVLDPALLRPGRFDRQVTVNLPDVRGREAILSVHGKKVRLEEGVDLGLLARGTPGYSGAELANVINEAALMAARKGLAGVTMKELEEARDKVRWGKERRSLSISEKEREVTAYHEAGHALLIEMLEHTDPLHKVTIIPRGPSLGSTMWLPEEDKHNNKRGEMLDHLVALTGGRAAEEIIFGDITSGAAGDIKQATSLARKMVCQWGMSDKAGMVAYGEGEEHLFLARDFSRMRDYSELTAQMIDSEVKGIVDRAHARARRILEEREGVLRKIAEELLRNETLDGGQIRAIMRQCGIDRGGGGGATCCDGHQTSP
jgi:cell division protease FtsH